MQRSFWDQVGIGLSVLCAVHCLVTPLILLSLPIMARYYLAHFWVHVLLAVLILPVGIYAFWHGYRHHQNRKVLWLGLPGLFIVASVPFLVHSLYLPVSEPLLMSFGSILLIVAHWINRRSCACENHHH